MKNVIEFKNVYKVYKLFKSEKNRFLSYIFDNKKHLKRVAINYLNFNIKSGERVAFIGPNGAGKSTILKMITNVCYPNEGSITVRGSVAPLLELSAGFDSELTGRENIYLKCSLLGIKKKETEEIIDTIIEFADIGHYIDQPIRTYSSGMKARLGFSILIHSKPDILIIDEALSVGDKAFKDKCLKKIKEITGEKELTVLFVTHSMSAAKEFCERGIVINKGHLVFDGHIDEAIGEYNKFFT